ncbi:MULTISPECIES: hypothetical protein [Rhizobium]|uniref:hypothetical protein n=1 Tax=Rhizobium phaseoli TaxID=396 RepID=UPI0001902D8C|nr:hypothetical protein [Rhizobium phaseoli]KEC74171.1 hypothetical protein RLPCCGM1_c2290 [Rhizobium leguminosarum bv. phaseoli CCGM1]MDH6646546.1 hypothetical protein [Rhizobium esperanzae]ANL35371.1 hypothetical protein AMC89_CH03344 [Rhizobium phaseoli]ANL99094.1 hypothetical protein AMC79_CH03333 [Rhizobium phaseoli]PWI54003.1 hypothetical protein B5K03_16830 [Rhizobium phaseoli]
MLFGQSVFQSVLERLKAEDETGEDAEAPAVHRVSGLGTGLAFDVMQGISVAAQRVGEAYFDHLDLDAAARLAEKPVAAPAPVMPDHLSRTTPEDVAAELAISAADTPMTLSDKRRAFARLNHPDGVALPFRDNATKRMMLANLLIDEALRRLR